MVSYELFCLQTTTHNLLATTFQSILGLEICKYSHVQLVNACHVYSKSHSGTVIMNYVPTNFSLHRWLVWLGTIDLTNLICIVNIFQCHNQCGQGWCLPNCVQVIVCVWGVINIEIVEIITKIKSIHHSRLPTPLEPKNWRVAKAKYRSISQHKLLIPIWKVVRFKHEHEFPNKEEKSTTSKL